MLKVSVFQFYDPPRNESQLGARVPWKQALAVPGVRTGA